MTQPAASWVWPRDWLSGPGALGRDWLSRRGLGNSCYSCDSDCFLFQGAAEDPQMALALNFDPALIKKSDAEGPRLLFPESELSIRIGRAGLLSGKLPAADPGLGPGGGGMTRELPGALSCPSKRPTPLCTGQSWGLARAFLSHLSSNPACLLHRR